MNMYIEPLRVDEPVPERIARTIYELSMLLDTSLPDTVEEDIENIFKNNELSDEDKKLVFRIRYSTPLPYITHIEVEHMRELCGYA